MKPLLLLLLATLLAAVDAPPRRIGSATPRPATVAAAPASDVTVEPAPAPVPTPTPTPAPAGADQTAIARHLATLDARIAQLEHGKPTGNGAFRRGASLLVDGGGAESVLERLRRLEQELALARGDLAVRDATLGEIRTRAEFEQKRAAGLSEKADSLAHVRDSLVAAQQTLVERQAIIDRLTQRMAEADLARLQGERAFFVLAASVLKLMPGQTQDLLDLQEQLRQQAKMLQPVANIQAAGGVTAKDKP